MAQFEMRVEEIFYLDDSRTVFVGPVVGGPPFIGPCTCELIGKGGNIATFPIEGEMIPEGTHQRKSRSVSTLTRIEFDRDEIKSGALVIRFVAAAS